MILIKFLACDELGPELPTFGRFDSLNRYVYDVSPISQVWSLNASRHSHFYLMF